MKLLPIILSFCCVFTAASAAEQLPDEGYYRVKNSMSERYIYVLDNHGYIDWGATSADLRAIELWKGLDKAVSDPATVMYFDHIDGRQYDVTAQGTGIYKIIDYYVSLRAVSSKTDTYYFYATKSGMTKYLADGERVLSNDFGLLTDNGEGEWRHWKVEKISASTDNYFGVSPDLDCNGTYYSSFFGDFPFSFNSAGMKGVYVSKVDSQYGIAVVEEADGTFAGATPVIIKCASKSASGNRLNIGGTPTVKNESNLLEGVYFQNDLYKHTSLVENDKATMRVPAVLADGNLGFVTSDEKYMPRNKSYLRVPAGTPETVRCMTPAEYDTWLAEHQAGISAIEIDEQEADGAVYNLMGVKVADSRKESLRPGIYISSGKKIVVR